MMGTEDAGNMQSFMTK